MGRGTLGEVQDESQYPRGGPGRVGVPLGLSVKVKGTLGEVQDECGNPRKGPGWVKEPSGMFRTGR